MLNQHSVHAVDGADFGLHFRRPLYQSYNFVNLPRSLPWLFTGAGQSALPLDVFGPFAPPFDHVVFCFIDAFGWQHVARSLDRCPFLRHAADHGVLSKMTAMFPSTTAAHVTAIHTGRTPGQSGVYAWQYLEPSLGTIVEPLPFAFYNGPREGLRLTGIDPSVMYPGPSIYGRLNELGVRSFILHPTEIAGSTCNRIYTAGAESRAFKSLADGLVKVRNIVLTEAAPTYTFFYWDRIDGLSHLHGPDSEEVAAEIELVWLAFERLLHDQLGAARRTLLLLSADHGHMTTGTGVLLNRDLPDLIPRLKKDRLGRPLAPAGSRRDFFLHVEEEHLEGVRERLGVALVNRAEVHTTEELVAQGFFGAEPVTERFLARVGNLVVLPYANENVWWQEPEATSEKKSSHGGLTPEEMEIPLVALGYG